MVEEKCIKVFSVFSIGSYWIYLLLGLDILYGFIWDLIDYMGYIYIIIYICWRYYMGHIVDVF